MHWRLIVTGAVTLLLGIHFSAWSVPIVIMNPGFEDPATSAFNVGHITGWTIVGSGGGVWNINAAPLGFWAVSAPAGNQIVFVGREDPPGVPASIAQVLSDRLHANTFYTLTGQVGHPLGFGATPDPDTLYTVELLAGNTPVRVLSGTGPEGVFAPFQLTFDSTGSSLIGQALQIRLSSSKTQTAFDDIRLEADLPTTSVPEPSTLLLVTTGVLGLLNSHRLGYKRRQHRACQGTAPRIEAETVRPR